MNLLAEITGEERDAIYDLVLSHISGVDDLRMALEAEDFERARRLGIEFGDELRLLEDLGWGYSAASIVHLTMEPTQLHRVFTRLRSDAEGLRLGEEREEAKIEDEARDWRQRAARITRACDRVLGAITGTPSASPASEPT